jgi:hypothetical protein
VITPETSQRGAVGIASGKKVRAEIEAGHVQGFFCETLVTLEGIKNADRSRVFGSTAVDTTYEHATAPDGNGVTYINMRGADGPETARPEAGRSIRGGSRSRYEVARRSEGRNGPRDPEGKRYLAEQDETAIGRRLERHFEAVTAIEARGLGCAQAQQLALEIQTELGGYNSFIVYLGKPRNPAEEKKINRAIAEWGTATASPPTTATASICFVAMILERTHRLRRCSTTIIERG